MHIHKWGLLAEYFVIIRYFLRGYFLQEHRWKSKAGEIDLIFKKGKSLVFCEVKARKSKIIYEDILVSSNQKRRILNAADLYIQKMNINIRDVRLDLVVVRSLLDMKFFENWLER